MELRIKIYLTVALFLLLLACGSNAIQNKSLNDLKWLIGHWENISEEGEFYENWEEINDSSFYGESIFLVNGDTAFFETMTLEKRLNVITLIPITMNQNDGNPIPFNLISSGNGKFIFENKEHDFPQRIVYTNPQPDSLYAYIEGEVNGEYRKSDFKFSRMSD